MLEPDSRVILLDQLRPPHGYRLHAAVATTFTLDLEAAVVPPLAFASFEIRGTPDPVAALEAVRSCTDRVDVFCQAGQIAVPTQPSDLMAYLEPMVHPVHRPRPGFLFHPKMWFLDYRAEGGPDRFRLLCSTRNLAQSGAWDAVVTLDGVRGTRPHVGNRPLSAFVSRLPDLVVRPLSGERRERIEELASAARYVEFWFPEHVEEVIFHAFGIPGVRATPDFSGYRHLIVSPFCNDAGVALVSGGNTRDVTLVSRTETLDQLAPETLVGTKTLTLDPLAVLNLPEDDADGDPGTIADHQRSARDEVDTLYGLHAKVTVVERARRGHVFVGSPNATSAAYSGNVEFAVELSGGASRLGVNSFVGGDAGFAPLLMEYAPGGAPPPDPNDDVFRRLRNVLRNLAEVPFTLTVSTGQRGYDLRLQSDKAADAPTGHQVTAELLTIPGVVRELALGISADLTFPNVPLPDITPFVVLRVRDAQHSTMSSPIELSTVVHAALINDPPDRLDEILARQIDTPEKFLRLLVLLLGLGDLALMLQQGDGTGAFGAGDWYVGPGRAIFELVVNGLAEDPKSLREFDKVVQRLRGTEAGRRVIPEGFETLWKSVTEALP